MSVAYRVSFTNLDTRRVGSMLVCSTSSQSAASTASTATKARILVDRVVEATAADIFKSISPAQRTALRRAFDDQAELQRVARETRQSLERYGLVRRAAYPWGWELTDLGAEVADIAQAKSLLAHIEKMVEQGVTPTPEVEAKIAELRDRARS